LLGIKTTRMDITNELDVVLSVLSDRPALAGKAMSDAAEGKNITFYVCGENSNVTVVNSILSYFCLPVCVFFSFSEFADLLFGLFAEGNNITFLRFLVFCRRKFRLILGGGVGFFSWSS
jgi:hypothetical protein